MDATTGMIHSQYDSDEIHSDEIHEIHSQYDLDEIHSAAWNAAVATAEEAAAAAAKAADHFSRIWAPINLRTFSRTRAPINLRTFS